ncbi:ABC transporter permease [Bdellovibrio sp. 22V]|uniref:ABC transporter permease n=1 Tax=Bdellovibrio TaxID=958 RepID=UPI002542F84D|nr:ABC transporter permease [Bdellovibrio sp. 22V]WII71519.1 ABC transporter permease [Bdellovibrio sp. 22V]
MKPVERSRPAAPLFARCVHWILLFFLYLPIAVMILGALVVKEAGGTSFSLRWFAEVLSESAWMQSLLNSVLVAGAASFLATLLGTAAAMGLRSNEKTWRYAVSALSLTSLVFPEIVFALSLLSLFFLIKMELSLWTVIIAHVSFSISYVMMTVGARLTALDVSYEDAARDLGASSWQIQTSILLPLLKPAISAGFILSFLLSFDDFLITYFVNGAGQDTLPVKLYTAMKMGVSPKLNALSSLMFLMTLLITIFFFRSSSFRVLFEGSRRKNGSSAEEKNL